MNKPILLPAGRRVLTALSVLLLSACSALRPAGTPPPAFYSLDGGREAATIPAPAAAPTLIVSPPRAAAGFDSQRIIYMRQAHKLDYFSHNEWVDPPARMLGPLLVTALGHTGAFRAVVLAPGATAGDLRLDTEIIRLQHEFLSSPSRVHFTLRATLVEDKSRRVLAWREFDGYATATSDDPYGGVLAANLAVQTELDKLAAFCAEATRRPPNTSP
ncbi:MAG: ABC-type transport auxiliary lipoprotein family protein [Pseudomonadota bacterium]